MKWIQAEMFSAKGQAGVYKVFPMQLQGQKKYGAAMIFIDETGNQGSTPIGQTFDSVEQAKAACEKEAEKK